MSETENRVKKYAAPVAMAGLIWAIFEGSSQGGGGGGGGGGGLSFTIIVENADNPNTKIFGASVTYGTITQTTDSTGTATFTNAPAGPLPLSASAQGFNNYGPTQFTPTGTGPFFIPMVPTTGGIVYANSFTFVASQQFVGAANVRWQNANTIPINVTAWCVVKSGASTVALGQSSFATVQPGTTGQFAILFNALLAHGTYEFDFFLNDDQGRPVSAGGTTKVTATV